MTWLLGAFLALAVAGALNLALSVRAMRRGVGPVPTPPDWHPEYVAARARRTERAWARMSAHFLAHHWWVGVVAGVELALGCGGAAAVAIGMDSRPWVHEILPRAALMVVPFVFLTSVAAVTATAVRRLRGLSKQPPGRPGPGGRPPRRRPIDPSLN